MTTSTTIMRLCIVLAALGAGAVALVVVKRRIRLLETQDRVQPGTDPVLNLCVRATAAVFLAAIFGWLAAGYEPGAATVHQPEMEFGGRAMCIGTTENMEAKSTWQTEP